MLICGQISTHNIVLCKRSSTMEGIHMTTSRVTVILAFGIIGMFFLGADGCNDKTVNQTSDSGAQQAKVDSVKQNSRGLTSEQQNIQDRIKVTTDPTKVMWIHLIALDGKIVNRMAVRSKVTSSGKRLEPTQAVAYGYSGTSVGNYPTYNNYCTPEIIQPDGTYGSSDNYIFWFDPTGRYHQWGTAGGLGYLLTDYPIDLKNQMDTMTGLYNADKAAAEWQQRQEAELKKVEVEKKK